MVGIKSGVPPPGATELWELFRCGGYSNAGTRDARHAAAQSTSFAGNNQTSFRNHSRLDSFAHQW